MRDRIIAGVVGGAVLMLVAGIVNSASDGRLISLLGGATASDVEEQFQEVIAQVETANARFGKLELMLTTGNPDCGSPPPPPCPGGWIENEALFANTYPRGECRAGTSYRLCIRAAE